MRKEDICSAFSQIRAPERLLDKVLQRTTPRYSLRPVLIIAYTIFVGALCFVLGGTVQKKPLMEASFVVDYTMQAALINADGEIVETLQITVQGNIYGDSDKQPRMDLTITIPDSFRYRYSKSDAWTATSVSSVYDRLQYYVWMCYSYDTLENNPVFTSCAMSVEKEYLIMDWDDGEPLYLVAATDPNVEFSSILEWFEEYLDLYDFS